MAPHPPSKIKWATFSAFSPSFCAGLPSIHPLSRSTQRRMQSYSAPNHSSVGIEKMSMHTWANSLSGTQVICRRVEGSKFGGSQAWQTRQARLTFRARDAKDTVDGTTYRRCTSARSRATPRCPMASWCEAKTLGARFSGMQSLPPRYSLFQISRKSAGHSPSVLCV